MTEEDFYKRRAEERRKEKEKEEKILKKWSKVNFGRDIITAHTMAVGGQIANSNKVYPEQSPPTKYNEIEALKHLEKAREAAGTFVEVSLEGYGHTVQKFYTEAKKEAVKAFTALEKCPDFRPEVQKLLGKTLDPQDISKARDAGRSR
jgi:hypothetical protein